MKDAFLGLNFLAAWIALSLPLDIMSSPFEDMPENVFLTNFSLTSCFVGNSSELDILFSFNLSCPNMSVS